MGLFNIFQNNKNKKLADKDVPAKQSGKDQPSGPVCIGPKFENKLTRPNTGNRKYGMYEEYGSPKSRPGYGERWFDDELSAKLPEPNEDGTLFENRLWESDARVEPGQFQAPQPLISNVSALLEETLSTLNINDLNEIPLAKRYVEEIRERETGLTNLRKGMTKKSILSYENFDFELEQELQDEPAEKKIYYNAAVMLNNKDTPMTEREDALIEILKVDLIAIFKTKNDEYDEDLPENKSTLRNVASWIIEDIDRKGLYIDLDSIKEDILTYPLFKSYKDILSYSADESSDLGIRINPLYQKMQDLKNKIYSSGVFAKLSFRNIIIASAAKTSFGNKSPWNTYGNDPGAIKIMNSTAKCLFVEHSTPRWQLANALTMAYQIYDLTGRWINTFPYFYKSKLDKYMTEKYSDELPLTINREEAIASAYQDADGIKCSDCNKYIDPDGEVYAMRRTYCGTDGSEGFYCAECADKILSHMADLEKNGSVIMVYEESNEYPDDRKQEYNIDI